MISTYSIEHPRLPTKGYIIFSPRTAKYSRGGYYIKWASKPKIWASMGYLNSHLAQHVDKDWKSGTYSTIRRGYDDASAVIIEINSNEVVCTVFEAYQRIIDKRLKKDVREKAKKSG